ncbi:MAG TPA: hypothetical protein ENF73_00355 [Proteobacteria bacterium]|nr:hypothetical protein [Pseudomonadota bacterium]
MKKPVLSIALLLLASSFASYVAGDEVEWTAVADGVEYAILAHRTATGERAEFHVVRIDPRLAEIELLAASAIDKRRRTASRWCKEFGLVAAINAGMYQQDYLSNVGYMRIGKHKNNPYWHKKHLAALAFKPLVKGAKPVVMVDLDVSGSKEILKRYDVVIQNLRLIKGNGRNVWSKQKRKWSEAAVAMDKQGRVLFIFCWYPFTMWEFNRILLGFPLGVVRAMHVEGGPEASLSVHSDKVYIDLYGSYETDCCETYDNHRQFPIPNVLGVKSRKD